MLTSRGSRPQGNSRASARSNARGPVVRSPGPRKLSVPPARPTLVMVLFETKLWSGQRQIGDDRDGLGWATSRHGGDHARSEERRVGKERGSRWWRYSLKNILGAVSTTT